MSSAASGEEAIIQGYLAPLAAGFPGAFGLRDDCAALTPTPGHDLVLKTDAIAEGVHFRADDPPADIGWKALAVNVSDLAAKGATPRIYLLSLSFPMFPDAEWLSGFVAGLAAAQAAFGITLAGGDTDRRPGPISITPFVVGEVASGRMVRRTTALPGDHILVSGTLGDSAAGLAVLAGDQAGVSASESAYLSARYRRPEPRLALRNALAHATAAMDISDGLVKDLGRMCQASGGLGARIEAARVPVSPACRAWIGSDLHRALAPLTGGDDYEVLAAVAPGQLDDFRREAAASGVAVTEIGRFKASGDVEVAGKDGRPATLPRSGYDHF
jgi:thiamine-monophosphate kinase